MQFYTGSPVLFEKGFKQTFNGGESISDPERSYYYIDYDARTKSVNMEFQHFHMYYELMMLLSPKCFHFIEGQRYLMRANDIILLPPSVLHKSQYTGEGENNRIVIRFHVPDSGEFSDTLKKLYSVFDSSNPIFRFPNEILRYIVQPLNDITYIAQRNEPEDIRQMMILGKLKEFIYLLNVNRSENIYTTEKEEDINDKIFSVSAYIHNHYGEELSLSDLSEHFYMSPYYLSHQFKKVLGYNLRYYIQLTRIKNAEYLLLNSQMKVTDIANKTGFVSFSQFNRIFRKITGISPSAYRKTMKNQEYSD